MKRVHQIIILIFLLSTVINQTATGNDKTLQEIELKINAIESQQKIASQEATLYQKELEIKNNQLKSEVEKSLSTINWIISMLGIGGLGIFGIFFVYFKNLIKKKAEKIANKKIKKALATIVRDKEAELTSLIQSQSLEYKVRNESKLLVVSETQADANYMKNFLSRSGFVNVDYKINKSFEKPVNNYDLIIFDDHQVTKNCHDLFREYMEKLSNEDVNFIFFGDRFNIQNREKINFANSKFTLYSQIINSLKFRELMR